MATYTITSPNGKTLKITGENPPTEAELDEIFAEVDKPDKKGGLGSFVSDIGTGLAQGVSSLGVGLGKNLVNEKLRPMLGKEPLTEEELNKAYGFLDDKPQSTTQKISKFAGEIAPYMLLPEAAPLRGGGLLAKTGNAAITGGYQGAVTGAAESLKNQGDLSGALSGAGIGAGVGATVPIAPAITQKGFLNAFPGLKEKTVQQLIKPNSKGLDLTEETAQNLLMDTTEQVRNNYQNLLDRSANNVEKAIENLSELDGGVDALTLMSDINNTFNQYGGKKINPARNMTGKLENDLYELISNGADSQGNLAPIDLQKAKEQIGKMVKWDDATAANYYNPILEQVYGKYNARLSQLSPELAEANAAYSQLNDFMKNEGVRRILRNGDNIDAASSALRNYNNTVTKGNTNRNIQDLENLLVANGYEPFLNKIDDVNAANELLKTPQTGWNILDVMQKIKDIGERPILKTARKINQIGEAIKPITDKAKLQRLLPPAAVMSTSPMLYGNVEYNDYRN